MSSIEYLSVNLLTAYPFKDGRVVVADRMIPDDAFLDISCFLKNTAIKGVYLGSTSVGEEGLTLSFFSDQGDLLISFTVPAGERVSHYLNTEQAFYSADNDQIALKLVFGPGIANVPSLPENVFYSQDETELSPSVIGYTIPTVKTLGFYTADQLAKEYSSGEEAAIQYGSNIDFGFGKPETLLLDIGRGKGTGLYDPCGASDITNVLKLNNASPDSSGSLFIKPADCYSTKLLTADELTYYRLTQPGYTEFEVFTGNGVESFDTLQEGQGEHGLVLENHCKPKCPTENLNAFAEYLNRVKDGAAELYKIIHNPEDTCGRGSINGDLLTASGFCDNLPAGWIEGNCGKGTVIGSSGFYLAPDNQAYSVDGVNWSALTLPISVKAFASNGEVAIGIGGNSLIYSRDSVNWFIGTLPSGANLGAITYGNGKFVAVGEGAAYSTDGFNWTPVSIPTTNKFYSLVAYGNGTFVALGGNSVLYSTDGISWSAATLPITLGGYQGIAYGAGKFVAVSYDTPTTGIYSSDGITWYTSSLPGGSLCLSVAYGDDKFIASGSEGSPAIYSVDGVNWVAAVGPLNICSGLTYGNGKFVAVGEGAAYSTDGLNWTSINISNPYSLGSVHYLETALYDGSFIKYFHEGRDIRIALDNVTTQTYAIAEVVDRNTVRLATAPTQNYQDVPFKVMDFGLKNRLDFEINKHNAGAATQNVPYVEFTYSTVEAYNSDKQYGTFITAVAVVYNPSITPLSFETYWNTNSKATLVASSVKVKNSNGTINYGNTSGTVGCKDYATFEVIFFVTCTGDDTSPNIGTVTLGVKNATTQAELQNSPKHISARSADCVTTSAGIIYSTAYEGTAYSYSFNIPNAISYSVTGDLPSWLNVSSQPGAETGNLYGTPSGTENQSYTISVVTAATGGSTIRSLVLDYIAHPRITSPSNGDIVEIRPPDLNSRTFSQGAPLLEVTATNKPTSYEYSGYPPGLSPGTNGLLGKLNLTGLTLPRDYNVTIRASNASGNVVEATTVTVRLIDEVLNADPAISGQAYSWSLPSNPNVVSSLVTSGLPASGWLIYSNGVFSGTTISSVATTLRIIVRQNLLSGGYSLITVLIPFIAKPSITSPGSKAITLYSPDYKNAYGSSTTFSQVSPLLTCTATNAPTSYSLGTDLENLGLSITTGGKVIGQISNSAAAGSYTGTIVATNAAGNSEPIQITLILEDSVAHTTALEGRPLCYKIPNLRAGMQLSYEGTYPTWLQTDRNVNSNCHLSSSNPSGAISTSYAVTLAINEFGGTRRVHTVLDYVAKPRLSYPVSGEVIKVIDPSYEAIEYSLTDPLLRLAVTNSPTQITQDGLPSGLSLSGTSVIGAITAEEGSYNVTFTATNQAGTTTTSIVIRLTYQAPIDYAYEGKAYCYKISGFGNVSSGGYSYEGTLPDWLIFNSGSQSSCNISGTYSDETSQDYSITLQATDAVSGATRTQPYRLRYIARPRITFPAPDTTFVVGPPDFNSTIFTAVAPLFRVQATNEPTSFTATGFPANTFRIDSSGNIIGVTGTTPTSSFQVTITATNAAGVSDSVTVNFQFKATATAYSANARTETGASFNSSGAYLATPGGLNPHQVDYENDTIQAARSYSVWVKFNNTPTGCQFVFMQGGTFDYQSVNPLFIEYNGTVTCSFNAGTVYGGQDWWTNIISTNIVPEAGRWYHFVTTFTGNINSSNTAQLYVNGNLVGSSSFDGVILPADVDRFVLGSYPATAELIGSVGALDGYIKETGVWAVALSQAQISNLFNSGVPLAYNSSNFPVGVMAYWRLNNDQSNNLSLADSTGNGRTLTSPAGSISSDSGAVCFTIDKRDGYTSSSIANLPNWLTYTGDGECNISGSKNSLTDVSATLEYTSVLSRFYPTTGRIREAINLTFFAPPTITYPYPGSDDTLRNEFVIAPPDYHSRTYTTASPLLTVRGTNSPTSFVAIGLPQGLTINNAGQVVGSTNAAAGTYTVRVRAANMAGITSDALFYITLRSTTRTINITDGVLVCEKFTTKDGATSYTRTGTLPTGVQFNGAITATCNLSGSPTATSTPGLYTVDITSIYPGGSSTNRLILNNQVKPVITLSGSTFIFRPSQYTGVTYTNSSPLLTVPATNSPTSYSAIGLPDGLNITSLGNIVGSINPATSASIYEVTITATNAGGTSVARKITLDLSKITSTITWPTPEAIVYGTKIGSTQLNATANRQGTFTYNPPANTVLVAGSQALTATFTPVDSVDYAVMTSTVYIRVDKFTPTLTWTAPSSITYGTALSSTQLNAVVEKLNSQDIPGVINYFPPAGTVPGAGTTQLTAVFTPEDQFNVNTAQLIRSISITKASQSITMPEIANRPAASGSVNASFVYLATASSGLPVTLTVTGPATVTQNLVITATGKGLVTLKGNQAGDSNYNAATEVTTTFSFT